MEEQQLSTGSCSCPPFGPQAWYFVHDDYLRVIILNFNFEKSGLRKDGWTTAWWWQQLARQSPCPAEFSCKRCSLRLFQISCLVFLSPPFICYSYFFTDSFFCFLLVSSYLIFYSSHSLICFVLPLFLQYDNFLRAQRSHGRFRGNQRWTFWRWELNLKSCKKLKSLKKSFNSRNKNMQKKLLTLKKIFYIWGKTKNFGSENKMKITEKKKWKTLKKENLTKA